MSRTLDLSESKKIFGRRLVRGGARVRGQDPGWGTEGLGRKLVKAAKVFQQQRFNLGGAKNWPALVIQFPKEHHRPENYLESQNDDGVSNKRKCFALGNFLKTGSISRGNCSDLTGTRVDVGNG